jgi:hypothetical protein
MTLYLRTRSWLGLARAAMGCRRHDDHRRTQQPAIQRPGRTPCLKHGAGRMTVCLLLIHCLVQASIKGAPRRVMPFDAVAFQQADKAAFDAAESLAKPAQDCGSPLLPQRLWQISAPRIAERHRRHAGLACGHWQFQPPNASSGRASGSIPVPDRRPAPRLPVQDHPVCRPSIPGP